MSATTSAIPRVFHRALSTTSRTPARSTAYRPKRDPTQYGLPTTTAAEVTPRKQDTDTSKHPLWAFFHDKQSLEVPDKRQDTSRSYTSLELRLKSFDDLHALWYIILKERNVLLTQREEARRLRLDLRGFSSVHDRLRLLQKSQARIKQTLSERRLAAMEAAQILRDRAAAAAATSSSTSRLNGTTPEADLETRARRLEEEGRRASEILRE